MLTVLNEHPYTRASLKGITLSVFNCYFTKSMQPTWNRVTETDAAVQCVAVSV